MSVNKTKIKKKNAKQKTELKNKWFFGGLIISVLILAFYSQTFKFEFVNWDDDVNVYENENVINFNLKGIFTEHVIGNYNPLSNLSFAVEYQLVQDNPKLYHIDNVLLHIICTFLVYLLMKELGLSFFVAFFVALLFGIHPMRVESVAWITERKDVLFGTFYLLSLLVYISYIKKRKSILFLLSILVFGLSLLSKIQAVSLPFSLLLIDYWLERKFTVKTLIEKIPFFLLSFVTGLIGIHFLRQQGSLDVESTLPLFQRIFVGSYSYIVYIIKSIFPFQMSAVYPFPAKLSIIYYISMLPALAIFLMSVFKIKTWRIISFGVLFFTANIVFVLQVIGAGQGFIADRFTYIPYIGLFFIYAVFIENIVNKFLSKRILIYSLMGIYLVLISVLSVQQIKTWENGETLWTDVISKKPDAAIAFNNLGHYYGKKNEPEKALKNYDIAIGLQPQKARTYNNRGKIYFDRGEYDLALEDYNKSLSVDSEFAEALANRGAVFGVKTQFGKALEDLNLALKLNPKNMNAISNRGFVYFQLKEFEKAIDDCNLYLQFKPNDADVINMVGLCYANLKDYKAAIKEYNRAIQIAPSNAILYANRSYAYNANGEKTNALNDALQARKLGFNVNQAYIDMLSKQ